MDKDDVFVIFIFLKNKAITSELFTMEELHQNYPIEGAWVA